MAIRLIRQDSDTPNVTNHDDARMVRYAYGGYDGFIKDRGLEIGHAVNGTSFIVQSGVINLQGWEVEIDANGVSIPTSASVANKLYYSVYLEVNCATDTAEIKSLTDHAGFPDIPASDDLTQNTIGTARLLLYHFTATGGIIADVEKMVQGIEYMETIVAEINQRLDEMGFNEASIENGGITLQSGWMDAEAPECTIKKLGKYAILEKLSLGTKTNISTNNTSYISSSGGGVTFGRISSISGTIVVIPEGYRPKNAIYVRAFVRFPSLGLFGTSIGIILNIDTEGNVKAVASSDYVGTTIYANVNSIGLVEANNIGWELP